MRKRLFSTIFIYFIVILMILPFFVSVNHALTRFFEEISVYEAIQSYIVPVQTKLIVLILSVLGVSLVPTSTGMLVGGDTLLTITWNCIGWQSLLLFFGSLAVALKGSNFSLFSCIKVIILGLCGIFWVNILRMSFTVYLATLSMPIFRIVFHDYLAAIVTIVYLFGFWWFAYSFVLETKKAT